MITIGFGNLRLDLELDFGVGIRVVLGGDIDVGLWVGILGYDWDCNCAWDCRWD